MRVVPVRWPTAEPVTAFTASAGDSNRPQHIPVQRACDPPDQCIEVLETGRAGLFAEANGT